MRNISILCPPGMGSFDFETMNSKGLGGTETCILMMAHNLSLLGVKTNLYGPFTSDNRGDLRIRPYDAALLDDHDLLIYARNLWWADELKLKYNDAMVWVHDTGFNVSNEFRESRINRVLALSNWHKSRILQEYPHIDPRIIILTQNGINSDRFKVSEHRNQANFIYSSGPDRGLEYLLDYWPEIKRSIPDAHLYVFSRIDFWEKCVQGIAEKEVIVKKVKKSIQDLASQNVYHAGYIGQKDLAIHMSNAKLWLYPTDFTETFCISAIEAQMAGCSVVTSRLGALPETVKFGTLIEGTPKDESYKHKFIEAVVREYESWSSKDVVNKFETISNLYDWKVTASQWKSDYLDQQYLPFST